MKRLVAIVLTLVGVAAWAPRVSACPFCVAEMQTLSEEISGADVAVIARLVKPTDGAAAVDPETGEAPLDVASVLKGADALVGVERFEAIYFGAIGFEKQFLVRGFGQPIEWSIPIELSPLAVSYVKRLPDLPESGADRLAFFQDYLEHDDRQLAQDAYDEFARAPYADIVELKDRIDHDRVVELINRPGIAPSRRRLFFVLLSVCGTEADLPMLEALLESDARKLLPATRAAAAVGLAAGAPMSSVLAAEKVQVDERQRKLGLDAMIACYLTLRGDDGLDLIDRRFLAEGDADQAHLYPTLMALRFLADEEGLVSRERLLASARLFLNNRDYADQVITDLARWEDWSVLPKLGQMYREAVDGGVSPYVREPIVTFLDIAAEQEGGVGQEAQALIAELESTDAETFARARSLAAFGFLGRARPVVRAEGSVSGESELGESEPGDAGATNELEPPDPAAFAAADAAELITDGPPAETPPAQNPPATAPAAKPTIVAKPIDVPAGAEPLTPPSPVLLVGVPLLGVAGCFGLFWFILRGGG